MTTIFIALALGWKISLSVLAFLAGIGIGGGIIVTDMAQNFETGYGDKSKTRARIALAVFVAGIIGAILILFCGCATSAQASESVPNYRNGKPNALVCPDEGPCFQCDHQTAKLYRDLFAQGKWDGAIEFLPLGTPP